MRIARVEVKGLFGLFDHTITLRTQERITILFGINGIGKTVILKMISGLLRRDLRIFRKVPFSNFAVHFDDASCLAVVPLRKDEKSGITLNTTYMSPAGEVLQQPALSSRLAGPQASRIANMIDEFVPFSRGGPDFWIDDVGAKVSLDEVVELYGERFPRSISSHFKDGDWPADVARHIPDITIIETQRLHDPAPMASRYHATAQQPGPTVAKYSKYLTERIARVIGQYAKNSQELDRTFPTRLFAHKNENNETAEQLREKLAEIEAKRSKLTGLGFLDKEQALLRTPPEEELQGKLDVMTVYVADVERKLSVFDDLAERIELFKSIINNKFEFKELLLNRESGFSFRQQRTGTILQPADLSSGEQHELVLLYDLLFRLEPHSMVLIDEPEISLHVTWQQRFLEDLLKIVELSDLDVIVATHSPEIIGDRFPLVVTMSAEQATAD